MPTSSRPRLLVLVGLGLLGVVLGLVGAGVIALERRVGPVVVPWGLILAVLGVACTVRGAAWFVGSRRGAVAVLLGWLVPTIAFSAVNPGGDVVLTDQPDTAWTQAARVVHRELLRQSRHTAAKAALRVADHTTAVARGRAAVAADPFDEAAYRILMQAHWAAAEPGRALRVYERLRTTLARELGCDPSRTTQDLHVAILRANCGYGELSA